MADTPTPAYSVRIRVRMENRPGMLGELAIAIGAVGANISALQGFEVKTASLDEDVVVNCASEAHQEQVRAAVEGIDGIQILEFEDRTFHMHEGGKIEVLSLAPVRDVEDLSMAYTPGVARVCMEIAKNPPAAHRYTIKKNTVAIVSDGTAVLGLGDIGPEGAMPVMEGKALLFKHFAGVDAFPICLNTKDPEEIIETVLRLEPTFGGINLEDIAAPGAFEVEERLDECMDIPVFHDDQHGTAIVTLAALENALKIVDKDMADLKVVVAGVGAAGVAVSKILMNAGVRNVIGADRQGAVHTSREGLNRSKQWFAENTNPEGLSGSLTQIMPGADVFIGLSGPNLIERSDVERMASNPIVFAMANPDPEIRPELIQDVAAVIATGRSDFPNQINNVLAFPGVFRGALDAGARRITENMKVAAARAIASTVEPDELAPDFIIPSVFNPRVSVAVAEACAEAARADGVCR
ncbi:MAG TPA: NAD-dependent malic enzyme [Microthrixaceae bacterium]|nr:NAD-dependent malic enzyme [Microthrixaceae bacterium]MCO5305634.1 NAD-dependent malic enzyme [Microthrixaceae bacterium]HMU81059.1 NAD-dependent malic enzyme [Microthrixaceae bacterium]HMX05914.1 NAD-dependent malic enzyme [Microthrixaceae bacterium]HMX64169.1 NAD-dependent malic enzyme [Microthrixaceae bacterium]